MFEYFVSYSYLNEDYGVHGMMTVDNDIVSMEREITRREDIQSLHKIIAAKNKGNWPRIISFQLLGKK